VVEAGSNIAPAALSEVKGKTRRTAKAFYDVDDDDAAETKGKCRRKVV